MPRFITLAGRKQVGKDTSARYIKNMIEASQPGVKVYIVHFADSLKEACSIIFGIPRSDMETEVGKKKLTDVRWPTRTTGEKLRGVYYSGPDSNFMTVREVLQFVGTELFRTQLDPDIWVKSVFRGQYGDDDIVIVADCRFPNEAEYALSQGLLLKVERDTGFEGDLHASETALDSYDNYHQVIVNNGSFENLRVQLEQTLRAHNLLG